MPIPRYKIESMSIADFNEVHRLWQSTEGIGLNESDTSGRIRNFLKRNPAMSFVARCGDGVVGAVLCGHDGRRGYLHHLAVSAAHRGNGLGKKLVSACLRRLKGEGILKCNIFLFADNHAGERFWMRNGWVKREDIRLVQKNLAPARRARCC